MVTNILKSIFIDKYFNIKDIAGRYEYAIGSIFIFLIGFISGTLDVVIRYNELNDGSVDGLNATNMIISVFFILLIIPTFCLNFRRLKAIGSSGWFILAYIIPVLNFIFMLWLLFTPSKISQKNTKPSHNQNTNNNYFYIVAEEMKNNIYDEGLKLKSFSEHPNDENLAKALYIKLRTQQLNNLNKNSITITENKINVDDNISGVLKVFLVSFFIIAILGIVASIAIPSYKEYTIKTKVAQAMSNLAEQKIRIAGALSDEAPINTLCSYVTNSSECDDSSETTITLVDTDLGTPAEVKVTLLGTIPTTSDEDWSWNCYATYADGRELTIDISKICSNGSNSALPPTPEHIQPTLNDTKSSYDPLNDPTIINNLEKQIEEFNNEMPIKLNDDDYMTASTLNLKERQLIINHKIKHDFKNVDIDAWKSALFKSDDYKKLKKEECERTNQFIKLRMHQKANYYDLDNNYLFSFYWDEDTCR